MAVCAATNHRAMRRGRGWPTRRGGGHYLSRRCMEAVEAGLASGGPGDLHGLRPRMGLSRHAWGQGAAGSLACLVRPGICMDYGRRSARRA